MSSKHVMAKSKRVGGEFQALLRMTPGGRWHAVKNTKGEPCTYLSSGDAVEAATLVGRAYRTGAGNWSI